ncbi:MAG: hypothetical protein IPG81_20865 [Sandaracinaceae bacterium]|nr:hypothetical protein [Sandaracinaceae bacterium]
MKTGCWSSQVARQGSRLLLGGAPRGLFLGLVFERQGILPKRLVERWFDRCVIPFGGRRTALQLVHQLLERLARALSGIALEVRRVVLGQIALRTKHHQRPAAPHPCEQRLPLVARQGASL